MALRTPSLQAEHAVFHANALKRFAVPPVRTRIPWRRVRFAQDRLLLELALPRATGAAEDYLLLRATAKLNPTLLASVPPRNPPDAVTRKLRRAAKSFLTLTDLWRDDLGIELTTQPEWPAFEDWRNLRHVLVHRLGQWQPGLDPKPSLATRIAALGEDPARYRGLVPLNNDDLAEAITNAIAVVTTTDPLVT